MFDSKSRKLYLYNTLTKQKEIFTPLRNDEVRLYSCGPTVYYRAHIGNMRSYLFSDLLRRVLEYNGYNVKQVINITDVGHLTDDADAGDDKLEKAAIATGETTQAIAKKYTDFFLSDIKKLNIETRGTLFPKATNYIEEQIAMVQTLIEIGSAYVIDDGVYYDTTTFEKYGELGSIDISTLEEGARVEVNVQKRNPTDFAIWKFSGKEKRQQEWNSPWGVGFPGWHIECSAMSRALLGRQLDIHTGGIDHIPVHHNNEIAQSEAVNKKKFVQIWMHNEFINIEGRKMSKSLGNLINLDQIIDRGYSPLSYRYWLLTSHYKSHANFTWEAIEGSHTALKRIHKYFIDELSVQEGTISKEYEQKFHEFINDDLDTPKAIALLWELIKDDSISKEDKRVTLLLFDTVLGLGLSESDESLTRLLHGDAQKLLVGDVPKNIQKLVTEREKARKNKDFEIADKLREEIEKNGYTLEDTDSTQIILKRES